jgi:hypothetical protein
VSFPSYNPNLPPLQPKREFSGWKWFLIILGVGLGLAVLALGIVAIGSSLGEAWKGAVS